MMEMREFQRIGLRCANLVYTRILYALNYPQKPQILGLMFLDGKDVSFAADLIGYGFQWHEGYGAWIVERTEGERDLRLR